MAALVYHEWSATLHELDAIVRRAHREQDKLYRQIFTAYMSGAPVEPGEWELKEATVCNKRVPRVVPAEVQVAR